MPAMSDDQLNQLIATDPQIQQIIKGVWGETPVNQRPSKTPSSLGSANDQASKQIAAVLKSRGIQLPDRTFINPRSAAVEHMHGWAGLPPAAKVAIIGGAAATGIGALGAMGALGGSAAAGGAASGAAPSIATTAGITGALPGTAVALPGMAGAAGAVGAAGAGTAASVGGGAFSTLAKKLGTNAITGLIGAGASGAANAMAKNRGEALDASMLQDQMATQREAEDRAERDDAWKKLQNASYVQNYQPAGPTTLHTSQGDRTLPDFGFGPKAPTQAELDGAQGLQAEVLKRLQGGSQLPPPTNITDYTKQGGWEKLLGIVGAGAPIAGRLFGSGK